MAKGKSGCNVPAPSGQMVAQGSDVLLGLAVDDGLTVGLADSVGTDERAADGREEGISDGSVVGLDVGIAEGSADGSLLGYAVGSFDGIEDGELLVPEVGSTVGTTLGTELGVADGLELGSAVGRLEGEIDGVTEGMGESKHRVQQFGKSQLTSGTVPAQSDHSWTNSPSRRRSQMESGISPTKLLK
mmetsp:Transcript_9757/g.21095  ORF Transcript_9757/g.21095 Transcript_9757/m.21095 type:complete len:187 (+) Transcript_9757:574-1134(+)